jgi:hypothetical protein
MTTTSVIALALLGLVLVGSPRALWPEPVVDRCALIELNLVFEPGHNVETDEPRLVQLIFWESCPTLIGPPELHVLDWRRVPQELWGEVPVTVRTVRGGQLYEAEFHDQDGTWRRVTAPQFFRTRTHYDPERADLEHFPHEFRTGLGRP